MTQYICDLGSIVIEAESEDDAVKQVMMDIGTGDTVVEVVDVWIDEEDEAWQLSRLSSMDVKMPEHDAFETRNFTPKDVLDAMVQEIRLGSCLMPLPDEFVQQLKDEGEVDPETSITYFYIEVIRPNGDTDLMMLSVLEAIQIHEASHRFVTGMLESMEEQLDDE